MADRPTLRDPQPPWLEYSFYVHERPSVDGFADLVRAVLTDGATPIGVGFYRGPGMRGRLAESLREAWDEKLESVAAPAVDRLEGLLRDPDVLVISVDAENRQGLVPEASEQIGFCHPIEIEAVRSGRIPFQLVVEGEFLEFASPAGVAEAAVATYERFRRLCEAVRPDYAACAEEEYVDALIDLEAGHVPYALIDFYVRTGFVGEERAGRLRKLYADAFVEDWAGGFFVSTSAAGNPAGIGIANQHARAIRAGRIIAGLE